MERKIIFGCARIFGSSSDLQLLGHAYDRGIRIFDTALSYGSDVILGNYFFGQNDVKIGTKIGVSLPDGRKDHPLYKTIYRRFGKPILSFFPQTKRNLLKFRDIWIPGQTPERKTIMLTREMLEIRVDRCLTNLRMPLPEYILLHEPRTFSLTQEASLFFDSLVSWGQTKYSGAGFGEVVPDGYRQRGQMIMCHWSSKTFGLNRPRIVAHHGLLRDGGLDYLNKVPELDHDYLVISSSTARQLDEILDRLRRIGVY